LGVQGALPLSLFADDLVHELEHHLLDIQGVSVGEQGGE